MEPAPDPRWLAERDVVTVVGADALGYLQSQLSQEIRDLAVGETRWTFLLQPDGKVDVLARITRTADTAFSLDTDPGYGEVLLARINRFKIRVDAATELTAVDRAPDDDAERERIIAGWPRMGAEIVPGETIPGATGVVALAVNFKKGCYPGQELVERMDSRGASAPRSLVRLTVDAGSQPGDPVLDDSGAEVGVLTSVAGTAGLALVKRGAEIGERISHS